MLKVFGHCGLVNFLEFAGIQKLDVSSGGFGEVAQENGEGGSDLRDEVGLISPDGTRSRG